MDGIFVIVRSVSGTYLNPILLKKHDVCLVVRVFAVG
jgi:hypothetical protein